MCLKRTHIFIGVTLMLALLLCYSFAFAEENTAQISGMAWLDKDVDGFNENESALSDVRIALESLNEDGTFQPLAESVTGDDGYFLFGTLPAGQYRLLAELPSKHQFTMHGGESAMLPASGNISYSPVFSLSAGEQKQMNIGGTKAVSYISIVAFEDENANGGRMSSENLIRNVQVALQYEYEGTVYTICEATTNKEGAAKLDDLTPGTYRIAATLPDGYIYGPLGQKINAFYNCVPPTENGLGVTEPFALPVKDSVGIGIGAVKTGSLSGSVWYDANANGQQDGDESGFAGLKMTLYSPEMDITRTTKSDENGVYRFENLQEGAYELTAHLSDGVMFAYDNSIFTSYTEARCESTALSVKTHKETIADPIGVMPDTVIILHAYEDVNGNHVYDSADEGGQDHAFPGAELTAVLPNGQEISAITDENGTAYLRNVRAGDIALSCQLPDEYIFTLPSGDVDFAANVGVSSLTSTQTISHGQETHVTALVTKPVSISGTVFEDAATAGIFDDNSVLLSGFTVQAVFSDGSVMAEAVTDENGSYTLSKLLPGEYRIRMKLDDPYISSSYAEGQPAAHANALSEQNMDYGQTSPFVLLPGESAVKDAAVFKAGTVDGYVLLNPAYDQLATNAGGLSGVTVYLLDEFGAPVSEFAFDTTDDTGYFYIKGILPGTYALSYEMPSGAALTHPIPGADNYQSESFVIENGSALHVPEVGAVNTCTISGFILHHAAGNQLPVDAKIQLIPENLETIYETDAMENGEYILTDIMPDTYTLEITLPEGYAFDHAETSPVPAGLACVSSSKLEMTMGRRVENADIAVCKPAQLQGMLYYDLDASTQYNDGESAITNQLVAIENQNGDHYEASTNELGQFAFEQLLPGEYTLSLKLEDDCIISGNASFDGNSWSVAVKVADGDQNASVAVGILRYASVSGQVWSMDGMNNGVASLTIQLEKEGEPVAQTTTDNQGAFKFEKLYPGIYTVSATLPDGYSFARTVDTALRQSFILEGDSVPFEVLMGAAVNKCDIGIGAMGGIGDTAWLDENQNGMQDLDEAGIPGIQIELYQYGELAASTVTDVYGHYHLTDLFPGTYSMVVTMPKELKPTLQQTEFPLLASILPESEETVVTVENVIVPSGETTLNCDLGFALRTEGVYPSVMDEIPDTNWLPYSER